MAHHLSRRLTAALLLLTAWFPASAETNVLFLSIDDLKPTLGCYGDERVATPNIDRLAARGVLFERHYVQQAVCAPSRASMFTGLRPDSTGVWDLKHTVREENPAAFTVQQHFKEAEYATAGAGKIMHGFRRDDPLSWSIPYVHASELPYAGEAPVFYEKYQGEAVREAWAKLLEDGPEKYGARQKWMKERDAKPATEALDVPDDAYPDGAMTTWGIGMLDRFAETDDPFFLTLGYHKPHLPFVAPKKYWELFDRDAIDVAAFQEEATGSPGHAYHNGGELSGYTGVNAKKLVGDEDKQRELIHGYLACVAYVDAQVGRVLDHLDETGLAENTVVVLWGDHGWHLGDHGLWCKHTTFEQATRSPLIVAGPGVASGVHLSPVESVDLFPTLCELAGLPVPEQLEGRSLVPVLENPATPVDRFAMSQYPAHGGKDLMGYALRTDRHRLVAWVPEEVSRTGDFDAEEIDSLQLYDHEADPLETRDHADTPEGAAVVAELMPKLEAFFAEAKERHDAR